jgi:hypothetical protein
MSLVPSYRLIHDDPQRVGKFVADRMPGGPAEWGAFTALGFEVDGELVFGTVYDTCTGTNIFMHAAAAKKNWMRREMLADVFGYPFLQLGVDRITGPVASTNEVALRFDKHIGFEEEARLRGAVPGGDMVLLVLWKDKCKWLNMKGAQKWVRV